MNYRKWMRNVLFRSYLLLSNPKAYLPIIVGRFLKHLTVREYSSAKVRAANNSTLDSFKISVVFPTRNGLTNGVSKLISSLKAQTFVPYEIIAIDSGSTDGTQDFLRSEGVHVYDNSMNMFHHGKSRNIGANLATGDFILFTVDDAWFIDKTWIERALKLLIHSGADAISGAQHTEWVDDYYSLFKTCSQLAHSMKLYKDVSIIKLPRFVSFIYNVLGANIPVAPIDDTNHLVRKPIFDRVKFQTNTVEDLDFGVRLLHSGGSVIYSKYLKIVHGHKYKNGNELAYSRRIAIDQMVFREVFKSGPFNNFSAAQILDAFTNIFYVSIHLEKLLPKISFRSAGEVNRFIEVQRYKYITRPSITELFNSESYIESIVGIDFVKSGKTKLNSFDILVVNYILDKFYNSYYTAATILSDFEVPHAPDLIFHFTDTYSSSLNAKKYSLLFKYIATNYMVTLVSFSNAYTCSKLASLSIDDWS